MKQQGHIILRRRLYEQVIVLEDFLLELERYILYNSESQSFKEHINSSHFEERLKKQIIYVAAISELFLKKVIYYNEEDFSRDVRKIKQKYEQSFQREFEHFLSLLSQSINSYTPNELYNLSQIVDSNWSGEIKSIRECFENTDIFHSKIIQVMEISQEQ